MMPAHDRPFVDGTTDDSVFAQVFVYNGWSRIGVRADSETAVHGVAPFLATLARRTPDVGTFRIAPSPTRLLVGPLGRDDAWLMPAAVLSLLAIFLSRRRRPRTDPLRAAGILWGSWLLLLFGLFSAGSSINSYYTAALVPAIAALCAIGLTLAWRTRAASRVSRLMLAAVVPVTTLYAVLLIPSWNDFGWWVIPVAIGLSILAETSLLVSVFRNNDGWVDGAFAIPMSVLSLLLAPAITTGVVVTQGLGSFSTPYQSASTTRGTTTGPERYQTNGASVAAFYQRYFPHATYIQGLDTSYLASGLIMVTGREFLPIGGFSGTNPSPTLERLRHLVRSGELEQFFVPVKPAGDDPRLAWIRSSCTLGPNQNEANVIFGLYYCRPLPLPLSP